MIRVLCVLLVGFSATSFAAPKKSHEAEASEKEQSFSVAVPKSQMALEPLRYVPPRPVEIELGVSSLVPDNFARGSYSGRVSKFDRGSVPALSINRFGEIYAWNNGVVLRSKLGLTYMMLERSEASRAVGIGTGTATQTLNIFSGRAGFEVAWGDLLPWGFEPGFGLAVLPTVVNGDQSEFEKGVNAFGTPWEATLGLLWRTGAKASLFRGDMSAGVMAQAVRGSVGGSSLTGYGVQGVFRISL